MPDASTLADWGLPGLFLVAMVAGSVLPAPSEAVLAALVYGGVPPAPAVGVATVGNVLGAVTIYVLGRWVARGGGGPLGRWVQRRRAREGPRLARAQARLATWGAPVLVLAWVPVVGDVFVLAAGLVGVRWGPFVGFVTVGKGLRYLFVALSAVAASPTGISP
ncbi:YqaA family protein [Archangium lansingense]|uniref:DedA family protein n=1 Tax=Archangium lansingense TaxID=2995310 RepID=A0ABT4A1I9_9BACT|nr:YqaA family protein [Archangium lansinium]MCY1075490.1 DedA family protein [Archangium lansinium]